MTAEQYEALKIKQRNWDAYVDSHYRGKNGWASYPSEPQPGEPPRTNNDELTAIELYEFLANPPDKYFAYVKLDGFPYQQLSYRRGVVTTFTGEKLGDCVLGQEYRDSFGGRRVPLRINAINGREYYGTYYSSAGDYCRLRVAKKRSKSFSGPIQLTPAMLELKGL